jgi:hypothetical protein
VITASSTLHRNEGVGESNRAAKRSRLTLLTRLFRFVLALLGFLSQSEPFRELRRHSASARSFSVDGAASSGFTRRNGVIVRSGSRTETTATRHADESEGESDKPQTQLRLDSIRLDPTRRGSTRLTTPPFSSGGFPSKIEEAHEVTVSTVSDAVLRRVRAYVWSK